MINRLLAWAFPDRGKWERLVLFSLLLGFWISMMVLPAGYDLPYYLLPALRGENVDYPYPYWSFWFLLPLLWLPFKLNYILLVSILITALIVTRRWLQPSPWLLFLSFPFVWVLWYGQFETFVSMGTVLAWMALGWRQPHWIGVGFALMSIKPNIGFVPALAILWWLPNWRTRFTAAMIPGTIILISLVVFGPLWPLEWLNKLPFWLDYYTNGSLYRWAGAWAFLLYIPAVLVRVERLQRYRLLIATTLLVSPFVPNYSQLILYLFPLSWFQWALGFVPVLQIWFGEPVHRLTFLFPLSVALGIYAAAMRSRDSYS